MLSNIFFTLTVKDGESTGTSSPSTPFMCTLSSRSSTLLLLSPAASNSSSSESAPTAASAVAALYNIPPVRDSHADCRTALEQSGAEAEAEVAAEVEQHLGAAAEAEVAVNLYLSFCLELLCLELIVHVCHVEWRRLFRRGHRARVFLKPS